jgi:predicted nucleic acid-binding protein
MITAIDTNVLLDVVTADGRFGHASRASLAEALDSGSIVACEVVWAELASAFATRLLFARVVEDLDLRFDPIDADTAALAGDAWRAYRAKGGGRARVAADFLVGAHAQAKADRLLTRDRGFYRAYFRKLAVLDPSSRK